ncbi:glycoside hydrolase family 32 protein [Chryseobacterium wangxinyae]|uniref:glycoside hydrolase family 32 protein n=1 Tax=Chryseobacterium sp. CY350 TaxID=2997336 RepID=UPI002270A13C|nr:glycoside hydrolase family 32 protein [Chryseobacterium sp. CY350]MCY0976657.1 glycoside hydrolase family 32 protein [Chryseobacterium sp. CY350]WBZ96658.1 glycoside hydrolase family 32 protein [Chryseobacterium sp. CY350]
MKKIISTLIIAATFYSGLNAQSDSKTSEEQLYRPNYHFTPQKGWMNDPNGMFYLNGTYHLFFQYTPFQSVPDFSKMHWGHAISKDLIKWEELAPALAYDEKGAIFSGSAVVDKDNTSGFGDGKNIPVVAIFTYHDMKKEQAGAIDAQSQAIAYSLDNGKTWTKYSNNPVLKNPGIKDFRDPKVFWDAKRKQWVMGLAAQDRQHFYASKNLKDWTFLSEFGKDFGGHGGVWECPDLFPIKVEGTNEEKWVLIVNINPGGPNGGSAAQYFVGDFDGKTFKMDDVFTKQLEKEKVVWLDWGRDNYASVSFDNVPDNKRVIIGWMSNWDYSPNVPTEKWRGSSTIPREVILKRSKEGYILKNIPVSQLKNYKGKAVKKEINLVSDKKLISKGEIDLSKAVIDVDFKKMTKGVYNFALKNSLGEKVIFGIDNNKQELFIDRTKSGKTDFKNNFADRISKAPLSKSYQNATIKIVLDKTSIEIFFNNGEKVMTEIFFPNESFSELSLSTDTKGSTVNFNAHQINIK